MNLSNLVQEYLFNQWERIFCPFCKVSLGQSSANYCNCKVGDSFYFQGNYYKVTSIQPWYIHTEEIWYQDPVHFIIGGPIFEKDLGDNSESREPGFRVPNKWNGSKGRDDMRLSRARTFGGLKGSTLRARGTRRK
jgi:hypothetical protein